MTLLLANGTWTIQQAAGGEPFEPRTWTTAGTVAGLLSEPTSTVVGQDGQTAGRVVETCTLTCSPAPFAITHGMRVVDGARNWRVESVDRHRGLGLDHWTVHLSRGTGTAP